MAKIFKGLTSKLGNLKGSGTVFESTEALEIT